MLSISFLHLLHIESCVKLTLNRYDRVPSILFLSFLCNWRIYTRECLIQCMKLPELSTLQSSFPFNKPRDIDNLDGQMLFIPKHSSSFTSETDSWYHYFLLSQPSFYCSTLHHQIFILLIDYSAFNRVTITNSTRGIV